MIPWRHFKPIYVLGFTILFVVAALVTGCAATEPPTDFELGPSTAPPHGCVELKARGGKC